MSNNAVLLSETLLAERPRIVRVLKEIVVSRSAAEDLFQSLWIKVQGVRDELPIRNERAFLYRLAANMALDHRRSERRRLALQEESKLLLVGCDNVCSPERIIDSVQTLERVRAAAGTLEEPTRSMFRLNRIEGMTQRQIAKAFGVSTTTVENHIRHALSVLSIARDGVSQSATSGARR